MTTPDTQPSGYTLRDFTAAFFRQSRLAAACFAVVFAGVVAAVLTAPKVYDADLKLLVKRERADSVVSGTPQSDRATTAPDVSEQELLSEVELLQARDLLEQVVVTTGLARRSTATGGSREETEAIARAITTLRDNLTVEAIRKTWMIDVTYTSQDAHAAKRVLDALAELYFEKHLAVHRPTGAKQFFAEQAAQSAEELRAAQARLEEFGRANRIVSASDQQDSALQKVAEFEGLQKQAEVSLAETTRRIGALVSEVGQTPARRTSEVRTSDAAGLVQEMQTRIVNLEVRRTQLLQKYTSNYRLVTEVDEQLAQARGSLDEARRAPVTEQTVAENPTMQWLENEIARARSERAALETRVRTLRATVDGYRAEAQSLTAGDTQQQDLKRAVASAEEKYLLYTRKQEEARISDALDRTRIANVVIAQSPTVPSDPRRTRSLLLLPIGFVAALLLSVGAALAKDASSPAIRTPDELRGALDDVPVLAWVPAGRQ